MKHRHEDRALFVELRKLLLHPSDVLLGSLGGRMHRVVGEVEKEGSGDENPISKGTAEE